MVRAVGRWRTIAWTTTTTTGTQSSRYLCLDQDHLYLHHDDLDIEHDDMMTTRTFHSFPKSLAGGGITITPADIGWMNFREQGDLVQLHFKIQLC